jgi:hypothetical protein
METINNLTIKPKLQRLFLILVGQILLTSLGGFIGGWLGGFSNGMEMERIIRIAPGGAIGGAIGGFIVGIVICILAQFSSLKIHNQILSGTSHKGRQEYFSFSDIADFRIDKGILGNYRIAAKDGREILLPKIYFTKDQFEKVIDMIKNAQKNQ